MANVVKSNTPSGDKNRLSTTWECFNDAKRLTGLSFILDAAAEHPTTKCTHFITPEEDALSISWSHRFGMVLKRIYQLDATLPPVRNMAVWCNPPFDDKLEFIQKAYNESRISGLTTCMLIPYEPTTIWWRCMVDGVAKTVYEPRGRYNFYEPDGVTVKTGVNFSTCFVVFDGGVVTNTQYIKFNPTELPNSKPDIDLLDDVRESVRLARSAKNAQRKARDTNFLRLRTFYD